MNKHQINDIKPIHILLGLLLLLQLPASAQSEGTLFHNMVERVTKFGERIPQEKIYVHMDNTSYLHGDTIWFKAYLRRTDTDKPSNVSQTLYVELRDPDGYLKERKQIWMTNGEGDGYFSLADSSFCFGGYYELRAYTRWQLNWGAAEHEHTPIAEQWFFNKAAARDFFRDYDKLYSRVFPIYSEYEELDGEMYPIMWTRPMRRQFKHDPQVKPTLSLFPEGGNLVAGVENRVAFEATMEDGRYLDGWLYVNGDSTRTLNRGRGTFLITPPKGQKTEITFLAKDGTKVAATLDNPDENGVQIRLIQRADGWHAQIQTAGNVLADSLAITVMHEGRVEDFHTIASLEQEDSTYKLHLSQAKKSGVHQVTVFDTQGRVLADRLFFVTDPKDLNPTIVLSGKKEEAYQPYESITLGIKASAKEGDVSVAVRSDRAATFLHDNGNILTEMLLASEIRGFVPQPGWYFEADDKEHRQALDLLMMTQGWRRFPWQEMALRGHFELVHLAERTPILTGAAHTYEAVMKYDPVVAEDMYIHERFMGTDSLEALSFINERFGFNDLGGRRHHYGKDLKKNERADSIGATKALRKRLMEDGEKMRHEVKVHADFFHSRGTENPAADREEGLTRQATRDARNWEAVWGESITRNGTFRMELPVIDEFCYLTLAASDTTKWSKAEKTGKKKHQWYWHDETSYPEFYIRLSFPYPLFVKPYSYYQTTPASAPSKTTDSKAITEDSGQTTRMKEVNVEGKRRNRLRDITETSPCIRLDALDAYNMVVDAGLLNGWMSSSEQFGMALARFLVSDMGQHRQYNVNVFYGDNLGNPNGENSIQGENPAAIIRKAGMLSLLDSVYIYTDYAPRKEGDRRFRASNQPEVDIRVTLRQTPRPVSVDRYMKLPGFARTAEFYSPDYSKRKPAKEESDYRRTLYWNPYVKLDDNGEARIKLYNNSVNGNIIVDVQGQAADGTLLWNGRME